MPLDQIQKCISAKKKLEKNKRQPITQGFVGTKQNQSRLTTTYASKQNAAFKIFTKGLFGC